MKDYSVHDIKWEQMRDRRVSRARKLTNSNAESLKGEGENRRLVKETVKGLKTRERILRSEEKTYCDEGVTDYKMCEIKRLW